MYSIDVFFITLKSKSFHWLNQKTFKDKEGVR